MLFRIDPASNTSVYRQLCEQVKHAVAAGTLAAGDRLPTIREVAVRTRVNRNTVAKAYAELERDGVIVSRPGQGSFIADGASALRKQERLRILEGLAEKMWVEAFHLQVSREEVRELIDRIARRFHGDGENTDEGEGEAPP